MKQKLILNTILSVAAAAAIVGCSTGTANSRSTGQYIDDKSTAQRVRHNLGKDSLVKSADIHVESFRGNVHLTGFVDYPVQKQHAEQIARNTEGAEWIKNDIVVKSELPAAQVGSRDSQYNEPSGAQRSSAASQNFQSSTVESSSSGWVRGSKGMNSELFPGELKGEAAGAEHNYKTSASGTAQYNQTATQGDLAQRVKSDIQSDTTLGGQNVIVEQDGDKIILRGTVANKEQKEAIEAKAKAIPGVKRVSNKIDVQK